VRLCDYLLVRNTIEFLAWKPQSNKSPVQLQPYNKPSQPLRKRGFFGLLTISKFVITQKNREYIGMAFMMLLRILFGVMEIVINH
jgi:hypothetical protein